MGDSVYFWTNQIWEFGLPTMVLYFWTMFVSIIISYLLFRKRKIPQYNVVNCAYLHIDFALDFELQFGLSSNVKFFIPILITSARLHEYHVTCVKYCLFPSPIRAWLSDLKKKKKLNLHQLRATTCRWGPQTVHKIHPKQSSTHVFCHRFKNIGGAHTYLFA